MYVKNCKYKRIVIRRFISTIFIGSSSSYLTLAGANLPTTYRRFVADGVGKFKEVRMIKNLLYS